MHRTNWNWRCPAPLHDSVGKPRRAATMTASLQSFNATPSACIICRIIADRRNGQTTSPYSGPEVLSIRGFEVWRFRGSRRSHLCIARGAYGGPWPERGTLTAPKPQRQTNPAPPPPHGSMADIRPSVEGTNLPGHRSPSSHDPRVVALALTKT